MSTQEKASPPVKRQIITEWIGNKIPDEGFIHEHAADAVTIGGFLLVAGGAKVGGRGGMLLRTAGKFADRLDGKLSRFLGTDGRKFGKLLDVFVDKAGVAIEIPILWKQAMELEGNKGDARKAALSFIAVKHFTNAVLNGVAVARGREASTASIGRVNAYVDGMATGFFGISGVAKSEKVRAATEVVGYAFFAAGVVTGIMTTAGYYRQAFGAAPDMPIDTAADEVIFIPAEASPLFGLE